MHISKIELENIKSHVSSTFEFSRGTTAITGENGAGKTTIIEAIAWTLFDLLEYKKEDFVRRGAKKGSVKITFASGLDEREYVVYRDSGTGYNVTDPRLQLRIADKKEEVFRFLWQHLGLEPGTDLKSLFRQAIGVPQGTFTAIFLEGATERKTAFDKLLKVEEYRQAAEKLRDTSRFLDHSLAGIRESIARGEGELSRSETVTAEHNTVKEHIGQLTFQTENFSAELSEKKSKVKLLDEREQQLANLKTSLERSRSDKEKVEIVVRQTEAALKRAAEASVRLKDSRQGHEQHLAALGKLTELERERKHRDQRNSELAKTDAAIVNVKAEHRRYEQELKNIAAARQEIEELRPKAEEQSRIENEIDEHRNNIARAGNAEERVTSITNELNRLRVKYAENKKNLTEAEEKSRAGNNLPELEKTNESLVNSLAQLRADLELDEKFKSEIRDGFCPIIAAKCLNMSEGETLEEFVSSQSVDTRSKIAELEKQHETIISKLNLAREGQQYLTVIESYKKQKEHHEAEGKELNEKKNFLASQHQGLNTFEKQMSEAVARLKSLADPAARIRVLEKSLIRETELRSGLTNVESNLERLESERKLLVEQLDEFKDFDKHWSRLTAERDATIAAHRNFLANEAESSTLEARKNELQATMDRIAAATSDMEKAQAAFASAGDGYDAERHNIERIELLNSERRLAETHATYKAVQKREEQLATELKRFAELRKSLQTEFREKERLETVAETTAFIRDTLKEAAPRVARNYVYHVSLEANLMFREITGNAERTLKWAEDYSIRLEEDDYERPFQSFSGGEQMAAALSVRLALLKQLTDIRLAFFDEPTTNMDAERRENFAQQISRITHFDQLFVISHDDTFDSYVDNVIAI